MTRLPIALFVVLAASGCGQKSTTSPAAAPEASGAPAAAPAEAETPVTEEPKTEEPAAAPKPLTPCEQKMADFDKTLSEASFACKKDSDCRCYEGNLSRHPGSECGGVVDSKAAKTLGEIAKAAKKDGCGTNAMCEPWTCDPICENSRCQKGPREK